MNASDFEPCRECACLNLRKASRSVTQHYEAHFRGSGLRATQFTLLAILVQTGPMPMTQLARMLGMERTTLTRNLALLEQKGFIKLSGDDDARVRLVELTPGGKTAAGRGLVIWKRAQASVGTVLAGLDLGWLREGVVP
ncbi:MAG TPA: MarR family transcriptional regulator [Chthoniobacterales bacterium]